MQLPELVSAEGKYRVTSQGLGRRRLSARGRHVDPGEGRRSSRSVEGTQDEAAPFGLPADALFTSSRVIRKGKEKPAEVSYIDTVSVGHYVRIAYPEPPYDALVPAGDRRSSA